MKITQEAKEITDEIYFAYGSGSDVLFGISAYARPVIEQIIQLAIDIYERRRKKKGGDE